MNKKIGAFILTAVLALSCLVAHARTRVFAKSSSRPDVREQLVGTWNLSRAYRRSATEKFCPIGDSLPRRRAFLSTIERATSQHNSRAKAELSK